MASKWDGGPTLLRSVEGEESRSYSERKKKASSHRCRCQRASSASLEDDTYDVSSEVMILYKRHRLGENDIVAPQ